ncbi:hypothetical protein R1sor_011012 [Riccia sorocarpa]|uniref:Uncharacterized protein n=1 Tax=Riccia sorocarpa TaxID=122646 RepID=A0ABD3I0Y6_9MARC
MMEIDVGEIRVEIGNVNHASVRPKSQSVVDGVRHVVDQGRVGTLAAGVSGGVLAKSTRELSAGTDGNANEKQSRFPEVWKALHAGLPQEPARSAREKQRAWSSIVANNRAGVTKGGKRKQDGDGNQRPANDVRASSDGASTEDKGNSAGGFTEVCSRSRARKGGKSSQAAATRSEDQNQFQALEVEEPIMAEEEERGESSGTEVGGENCVRRAVAELRREQGQLAKMKKHKHKKNRGIVEAAESSQGYCGEIKVVGSEQLEVIEHELEVEMIETQPVTDEEENLMCTDEGGRGTEVEGDMYQKKPELNPFVSICSVLNAETHKIELGHQVSFSGHTMFPRIGRGPKQKEFKGQEITRRVANKRRALGGLDYNGFRLAERREVSVDSKDANGRERKLRDDGLSQVRQVLEEMRARGGSEDDKENSGVNIHSS